MKKIIVMLLTVVTCWRSSFAEWRPNTEEWGIPAGIKTEADVAKYEGYRKAFMWAGIGLLVGSVAALTVSGNYHKRAGDGITEFAPDGVHVQTRPGAVERQRRLLTKSDMWKGGGLASGILGVVCLTVSFSLRF